MRLGFSVPQIGDDAGPAAIRAVAERAEALGYDSLWAFDRILYPTSPTVPYGGTGDGKLPVGCKRVIDPIGALNYVAACTRRVRLGTSVLNIPFYNAALLARELTTLDVLSEGRLALGFGTGWMPEEYQAVGVDMKTRGARANEALDFLEAYWTQPTPSFKGVHFNMAESIVMKPVQRPRPRIYMAAFTPATMKRVAERTDGWNPAGMPVSVMKEMWSAIKGMAAAAGRDPGALELIVRANLDLSEAAAGEGRKIFQGSMDEIREDIQAVRDMGAHELHFDVQFTPRGYTLPGQLEILEQVWQLSR